METERPEIPQVIDEENFSNYFFDVRKNRPRKGQVMAKFRGIAELGPGHLKNTLIRLVSQRVGRMDSAVQLMRKLGWAAEGEPHRVLSEICRDLLSGMTPEEVEAKPHEYEIWAFYYTWPECVPDSPNWETIDLLYGNERKETFHTPAGMEMVMTSRFIEPTEQSNEGESNDEDRDGSALSGDSESRSVVGEGEPATT